MERQGSPFQIVTKQTSQSLDVPGSLTTPVTLSQGRDIFLTASGKQVLTWDLHELLSTAKAPLETPGVPAHCWG